MARTSKLAAAVTSATKRILGSDLPTPQMVKMPKAVHEIHVSKEDKIPAGTVITDEIAELAGFDDSTLDALLANGAIVLVEVLSSAVSAPAEDA